MAYLLIGEDGRNYELASKVAVAKMVFGQCTTDDVNSVTMAYDTGRALVNPITKKQYWVDTVFLGSKGGNKFYTKQGYYAKLYQKKHSI